MSRYNAKKARLKGEMTVGVIEQLDGDTPSVLKLLQRKGRVTRTVNGSHYWVDVDLAKGLMINSDCEPDVAKTLTEDHRTGHHDQYLIPSGDFLFRLHVTNRALTELCGDMIGRVLCIERVMPIAMSHVEQMGSQLGQSDV